MTNVRDFERAFFEPLDAEEFFATHADKRFAHIPGTPSKIVRLFGSQFDTDELATLLRRLSLRGGVAHPKPTYSISWYHTGGSSLPNRDQKTLSLTLEQAADALEQRYPGAMDIAHLDLVHRPLTELVALWSRAVRCFQSGDPEVVFFYRGSPGVGVTPHLDAQDAMQIMLDGSKRWRVSRTPVVPQPEFPAYTSPSGDGFIYDEPGSSDYVLKEDGSPLRHEDIDWVEVDVRPGDLIYLPAGTVHTTQALDEGSGSLGLSVFVPPATTEQFVRHTLDKLMAEEREFWISPLLLRRLASDDQEKEVLRTRMLQALDRMRAKVETDVGFLRDKLVATEADYKYWTPRPLDEAPQPLSPDTRLVRVFMRSSLAQRDGVLTLYTTDYDLAFDDERMWGFASSLHDHIGEFTAEETLTWSDGEPYAWEEVQPLIEQLLESDLLRMIPATSSSP